jgi:hypothetical protein
MVENLILFRHKIEWHVASHTKIGYHLYISSNGLVSEKQLSQTESTTSPAFFITGSEGLMRPSFILPAKDKVALRLTQS